MIEPDYLDEYRPNVGVCLFNKSGQVWVGERSGFPDNMKGQDYHPWQMPQGGVDEGEAIIPAAARELKEETGVETVRLLALTPGWLVYDFPHGYKRRKGRNWKGQKQKWVAMLFEGPDDEIDLYADDHAEFQDWQWVELEEVPGLIVPFKRGVYEELAEAFTPLRDFLRDMADRL